MIRKVVILLLATLSIATLLIAVAQSLGAGPIIICRGPSFPGTAWHMSNFFRAPCKWVSRFDSTFDIDHPSGYYAKDVAGSELATLLPNGERTGLLVGIGYGQLDLARATVHVVSKATPPPGMLTVSAYHKEIAQIPLWLGFLVFAAYPAIALIWEPVRGRRRRRKGLCVKCGYNLTGNVTGICSECGEGM